METHMTNFNIDTIKLLIEESLQELSTGDEWLDNRYIEQIDIIGHTNPYYKLFYLIGQRFKSALIVELGSWRADGAAHFASGNPESQVVTIDIHSEDLEAQKRCYEAANHYPNLTYINKWTWDAVEDIKALNQAISIIFIDAWHDYKYAKREWDLYYPLLADKALVICDDITTAYNFEGMIDFWNELPEPKFLDNRVHPGIPFGFCIVDKLPKENENVAENRGIDTTQSTGNVRRGRPR